MFHSINPNEPYYIKRKLAKLITTVAVRSWPEHWENLFDVLFDEKITRDPSKVAQTEMAVYFVEDLFEQLTIADFSSSIRPKRKE